MLKDRGVARADAPRAGVNRLPRRHKSVSSVHGNRIQGENPDSTAILEGAANY
jgi:hypothetical protein